MRLSNKEAERLQQWVIEEGFKFDYALVPVKSPICNHTIAPLDPLVTMPSGIGPGITLNMCHRCFIKKAKEYLNASK